MNIDEFRGKHEGRSAVVMGAGPSLYFVQPESLRRHLTIAVNSAILKVPSSNYFVSADQGVFGFKYWDKVREVSCPVIMGNHQNDGTFLYIMHQGINPNRIILYEKDPKMRWRIEADSKTIIPGTCSLHCAIHIAFLLGCSPVYLVGADCRYREGKKYFWEFDPNMHGELRTGEKTSWIRDERRKGRKVPVGKYGPSKNPGGDGYLGSFYHGWEKLLGANLDRRIIDVSEGALSGKVFPAVSIDDFNKNPLAAERLLYNRIWKTKGGSYGASSPEENLFRRYPPLTLRTGKRPLVVGAGNGKGFRLLLKRGLDVYACDISPEATKYYKDCPKRFKVCAAHKMPYKDAEFDAVVCVDVLEHIPEPYILPSLVEIGRVCQPGGYLILQAHCGPSVFEKDLHVTIRPHDQWLRWFGTLGKITWSEKNGMNLSVTVRKA